ncbi:endophilin-B1-like isoform X2 [Bolinopsis microptera]|uniref:endophilin-B1-like isoform X2 n=1 Tax=Bolinopsis microptera TaxID=2820187 RepID=UPI0030797BC6
MAYSERLSAGLDGLRVKITHQATGNLNMDDLGQSLREGLGTLGSMSVKGFDRAKQFSQEKMGNAVKTEFDLEYIQLSSRVEATQTNINKSANAARNFLQPNAAARLEDMFNEKVTAAETSTNANLRDIAGKIPIRLGAWPWSGREKTATGYNFENGRGNALETRSTYSEILGTHMKSGGTEIGDNTQIGGSLVEVGDTFIRMGKMEKEYLKDVYDNFFKPFSNHLQVEWTNINTEKRRLDLARLDLDAAKSKVRGARTPEAMQQNEQKVRESQAAFDRQYEQTKILLTDADRKSAEFTNHLEELVRSQINFHENAKKLLEETYAKMKK